MALLSVTFFVFLAIACLASLFLPAKIRYIWVLVCNLLFLLYHPVNPAQNLPVLSLLACVVLISFLGGVALQSIEGKVGRGLILAITLLCLLVLLFGGKYFRHILAPYLPGLFVESNSLFYSNLFLPLGFGFYMLQAIWYVVSVYRNKVPAQYNPLLYAAYISFFPGLLAGPINPPKMMLEQLKAPGKILYANLTGGVFRILWGFFKKSLLVNTLSVFTLPVLSWPGNYGGPALALAWVLFVVQLYFDFSAYSDIAIGTAYMLGFVTAENFNRPFAAPSFTAFWQRWHMSLTAFLKDAVYSPITGLAKPRAASEEEQKPKRSLLPSFAALLAFALLGAWHGPELGYLLWGGAMGLLVAINLLLFPHPKSDTAEGKKPTPLLQFAKCTGVTVGFTALGILFASGLYQINLPAFFTQLITGWGNISASIQPFIDTFSPTDRGGLFIFLPATALCLAFVIVVEFFALRQSSNISVWIRSQRFFVRWPIYLFIAITLILFGNFQQSVFIYSHF